MNDQSILRGIEAVLRDHVGITAPLTASTDLLRDLRLDSLKQLTLIVELENRFGICFESGDEAEVQNIGDLVRLIARRIPRGLA